MSSYRKTMGEAYNGIYLVEGNIDKIKDIVSKKQASKIDGVMVDLFTASAISQVYDKAGSGTKKKMEILPITKLAAVVMKLVNSKYVPEEVEIYEASPQFDLLKKYGTTIMKMWDKEGKSSDEIAKKLSLNSKDIKTLKGLMDEELELDENFKTKKLAMDAAAAAYKKQRDPSDAIEVYQLKDRSFVINHPRNSNGRNYIKDIGGKLIARVDEEFDLDEDFIVTWKKKEVARHKTEQGARKLWHDLIDNPKKYGIKQDKIRLSQVGTTLKVVKEGLEVDLDEASARADAKRSMSRDRDLGKKRDRADVDSYASDDDIKGASKNIMMQLRKAGNLRGTFAVEFGDKKKVKVSPQIAQAVASKYNSLKRPADKEKFQIQIAKSYNDLLKSIKESKVTESKFGTINKQLKGEK